MARTTIFTDDFDRADNADLGASWDNGYVGGALGPLQIVSNAVRSVTAGTEAFETINTAIPNNQWAQATMPAFTGSALAVLGVILRAAAVGTDTWYQFQARRNDGGGLTSTIYSVIAGTPALLASESATTWAATDILRAEAEGSSLRLFRNSSQTPLLTATDSNIASGRPGLQIFVDAGGAIADAQWDSFSAGGFMDLPLRGVAFTRGKRADKKRTRG